MSTKTGTPKSKCLFSKGSAGHDKTNWALSQGSKVHLISIIIIDDLKKVCDDCDLLVFDGMIFGADKTLQDLKVMISLTDHKFSRSIYACKTNAVAPAVKRIFCVHEFESVFGEDPFLGGHHSVQRRTFVFDTDVHWGKCFYLSRVEDGLVVPIVPSNTPTDVAKLVLDLHAKQEAKPGKKKNISDRSGTD